LTDTPPNLHVLQTAPDELLAAVAQIVKLLPVHIEIARQVAQTRRAVYLAHVEAGFSEEQALSLCRSLTL